MNKAISQSQTLYGSNNGKYLLIENTKIYYEEYGKGTPLLLLHGGFGSINDFQEVIPEFSKHYRVIAADLPGYGRSEQADSLSFEVISAFSSKIIDLLKLDSVYVLGYSDGGTAALLLAADRPDKVTKTVAYAAIFNTEGYTEEVMGYLSELSPEAVEKEMGWWLDDYREKSPDKDKWRNIIYDVVKMFKKGDVIPANKLPRIKNPVLIIQGDKDIVKPEHSLLMHKLIPDSQLCILPASTHFIFSENPELITRIAIEFFKN